MSGIVVPNPRAYYAFSPGIYGNHIPWHQRTHSPHYRPLASFAGARPYTPTHLSPAHANAFGHSYMDPEEERKQAEWLEWQGRLATTGGPPARPAHPAPVRRPGGWREIGIYGLLFPYILWLQRLHAVLIAWAATSKDKCAEKYAVYSRSLARWYWLGLTAYRQSRWPSTFRVIRHRIKLLLIAILVGFVAKVKFDEWRSAEPQPPVVYRTAPQYHVRSVTPIPQHPPAECVGHCFDPMHRDCDRLLRQDYMRFLARES
ncbi:hypothetical protein F5B19DRAFT_504263 [Rostrohypoxylon terebratum]|nr:hypothetical protein F5B19DRAFT_504263 [Rostrohypoxylon terebratum]